MAAFDDIIGSIGEEAMMRAYDGISLEDFGKPREDLDNRVMSCEEQRLNLAFMPGRHTNMSAGAGFGRKPERF